MIEFVNFVKSFSAVGANSPLPRNRKIPSQLTLQRLAIIIDRVKKLSEKPSNMAEKSSKMATAKKKTGSPTTRKARGSGQKESSGRNGSSRPRAKATKRVAPCRRDHKPAPMQGETIGQRIKIAREALGIAQVPLAVSCGLSQGYISDMERERRKKPSLEAMQKIAAALGVTVGQLIGE